MARIAFVLATLAVMAVCALATPSAPIWPSVYSVHASFHVPYFNTKVPLEVHYDARKGREFLSYYHGMDTYTYRFDTGKLYSIFPRIDTPTCQTAPLSSGQDSYVDILPKLDSKWVYKGLHGTGQQMMWEWTDVKYNFTNVYQFFVARHDNSPLRLHMRGFNFVLGSHPDEYVIHYSNYRPNHVDEKVFEIPPLCQFSAYESLTLKHRAYAMTNMLGVNMIAAAGAPALPMGAIHEKFVGFMSTHKKAYANTAELARRMSIFSSNMEMIEAHNSRSDVTYKLGVTQFVDMEMEEIHRVMIPNKYRRMQGHVPQPTKALRVHTRGSAALPESVNWVEKGAVNPPKDQGSCGSCWTFGTAGSLEGAWAIKTGQLLSLSEQQILDCAWFPNGNSGCDGGFAGEAFNWISSNQGIATEADYPYLMADGYCKARIRDSGVRVTGHVNVSTSEEALMDAVANNGPVAVAINAATPDFYYMQGPGIYNNPACVGGIDDLDHEVLVVGYGTDHINGKAVPYWLLKNSWGIIWGDKGFWKMARGSQQAGGMCGIHQQGRYALV